MGKFSCLMIMVTLKYWVTDQVMPEHVYIYIIIIMLHHQHGYPWPSLATPPYRPLLPTGLQGYIPSRQRAAVCKLELVVLPCEEVHRSRSLMSSSLLFQQSCIVFMIGGGGRTTAALWGAASMTCSILLAAF